MGLQSKYTSSTGGELAQGEEELPEVVQQVEPDLNQNELNMVIQMGIPELAAKHALWNTGNNSADMAVQWYFENMENPVIHTPLLVQKAAE